MYLLECVIFSAQCHVFNVLGVSSCVQELQIFFTLLLFTCFTQLLIFGNLMSKQFIQELFFLLFFTFLLVKCFQRLFRPEVWFIVLLFIVVFSLISFFLFSNLLHYEVLVSLVIVSFVARLEFC